MPNRKDNLGYLALGILVLFATMGLVSSIKDDPSSLIVFIIMSIIGIILIYVGWPGRKQETVPKSKLIETAKNDKDPDIRLAALEKLTGDPVFPELVKNEIEKVKNRLKVGMSLSEIKNILGSPAASMGGSEVVNMTKNVGANIPIQMKNVMGGKTFMQWDRPEGLYRLVIEDGRLSRIYSAPESTCPSTRDTQSQTNNQPFSDNDN